jgi:5'-methylthioinosine phosphorylase
MLAIIGGSGFNQFEMLCNAEVIFQDTPYGPHSAPITRGSLFNPRVDGRSLEHISRRDEVVFLPRHGSEHKIPPHLVNYRANIWVLSQIGVKRILACNVVGGISKSMSPGMFVIPNQIIDYTYGREHTFFDGNHYDLQHVEFTEPYSQSLRGQVIAHLSKYQIVHSPKATYGCTQGPRLETAAEVQRLHRDGCDIVGMTAMPEAVLAREMGMEYVGLSLVVNWAAGIGADSSLTDSLTENIAIGMTKLKVLLPTLVQSLALMDR